MSYADVSDLPSSGLPATALGALTVQQQQIALDNASSLMDSFFRGRYALPLLAWGSEVTEACCIIAAYKALVIRGYNPASGADLNLGERYRETIEWLLKVQKRAVHPDITEAPGLESVYSQPTVISSSVVDQNGRVRPNRGW